MKKSEIVFGVLRLPLDFCAIVAAFLTAYYLRPITDLIPGVQYHFFPELLPPMNEYIPLALGSGAFLVAFFAVNDLYSLRVNHRFYREFVKIGVLVTIWLMLIIAYYFLIVHQLFFSRIALAHIWLFAIVFVTFGRAIILLIQNFLLRFGIGQRKMLLIGVSPVADEFYHQIRNDSYYKVIGALSDVRHSRKKEDLQIIGTLSELPSIVKKYGIDDIIQADPHLKDRDASDVLSFCRAYQITYHFIPDLIRLQRTNVEVSMADNIPIVTLKQSSLDGWGHVYKRIFDLIATFILIILLMPIWILMPLFIKIDSRGPVIYKSRRQYKDKIFNLYKFRSMVAEADRLKAQLLSQNERKGPLFKIKNDPRITRLGSFLRKTSIDELPQLFNVLKGDMSLVGPRPHLPEEVEKYATHHYQVFAIKPGVTGLAQISGRSNLDFEDEVKLDVYYIENWSPWLDIKVILKSVGVVLKADGH